MKGHGSKFPRKKGQAIAALLTHGTIAEAAKSVGIGESTLRRWMHDQDFQTAYREARGQVVQHATAQIQASMGEAVEVLRTIMKDQDAPTSARATAAKAILDLGFKVWGNQEYAGKDGKPLVPENTGPLVLMPPMPKTLQEWEEMWKDHAIAEGMLDAPKPTSDNPA